MRHQLLFKMLILVFAVSILSCGETNRPEPIPDPTGETEPSPDENNTPPEDNPTSPPVNDDTNTPPPGDNSNIPPAPLDPMAWKLPDGHFIPAKMPMHLVYPRPDAETSAYARHKYAHPNMRYEIPIGVQGGAWPFKYELIEAPSGAIIGEIYGNPYYGTVSWVAPDSGSYRFSVRITDQDMNTINATWQVNIDASQFVFIQDGYAGVKTGSIDQPLEDFSDWYKHDRNDATYHNKIVVFRDGNYSLIGSSQNNGNVRLDAASKTASIIAYPGETPVIDCSKAKIFTDLGTLKDLFVAGIRWENGRQDVANAHFFWAIGDVSRVTWWRNHFHNLGPGTVGNDNTLPVFVSDTAVVKENILYKENHHTQINNLGKNGGYFEAYVSNHVLIEQNTAADSAVSAGFFAKGTRAYVSIRANTAIDNVRGVQLAVGNGGEARDTTHDHEICWNNVRAPDDNVLTFSTSNFYENMSYGNHIYRNTIVGGQVTVRFKGLENYKTDGNVVMAGNSPQTTSPWNVSIMDSDIVSNLEGNLSSGFVDIHGKLLPPYREPYLGTHGHEVAH